MKKSPADYPWVNFRPGDMIKTLLARASGERSISQTAKQDLQDYYAWLTSALPAFTHRERDILRETLNGWVVEKEKVHLLWIEVEVASDDPEFVSRIRSLSPFECWAIVQAFNTGDL
jgi:hypothetical protein